MITLFVQLLLVFSFFQKIELKMKRFKSLDPMSWWIKIFPFCSSYGDERLNSSSVPHFDFSYRAPGCSTEKCTHKTKHETQFITQNSWVNEHKINIITILTLISFFLHSWILLSFLILWSKTQANSKLNEIFFRWKWRKLEGKGEVTKIIF